MENKCNNIINVFKLKISFRRALSSSLDMPRYIYIQNYRAVCIYMNKHIHYYPNKTKDLKYSTELNSSS